MPENHILNQITHHYPLEQKSLPTKSDPTVCKAHFQMPHQFLSLENRSKKKNILVLCLKVFMLPLIYSPLKGFENMNVVNENLTKSV